MGHNIRSHDGEGMLVFPDPARTNLIFNPNTAPNLPCKLEAALHRFSLSDLQVLATQLDTLKRCLDCLTQTGITDMSNPADHEEEFGVLQASTDTKRAKKNGGVPFANLARCDIQRITAFLMNGEKFGPNKWSAIRAQAWRLGERVRQIMMELN